MSRDSEIAAQGRDGRKDHQRRTGNDPQGPTGRAAGTYVPSAATTESRLVSPETEAKLAEIGVSLFTIPPPTGEELHRLEGWRDNIERYGQDLWAIYHWIVKAQDGKTHGVYALAQWLEDWGVPDNTTKSGDYEEVFHARRS